MTQTKKTIGEEAVDAANAPRRITGTALLQETGQDTCHAKGNVYTWHDLATLKIKDLKARRTTPEGRKEFNSKDGGLDQAKQMRDELAQLTMDVNELIRG